MITNPEVIKNKYECGQRVADWIMSFGVLPLSRTARKFYFAKTKQLEEILQQMPWSLKYFNIYW